MGQTKFTLEPQQDLEPTFIYLVYVENTAKRIPYVKPKLFSVFDTELAAQNCMELIKHENEYYEVDIVKLELNKIYYKAKKEVKITSYGCSIL